MFEDFPLPGKALSKITSKTSSTTNRTLLRVVGYDTSVHSIVCCPEIKSERKTGCRFTSPELYYENYVDQDYLDYNYYDPLPPTPPTPPRVR